MQKDDETWLKMCYVMFGIIVAYVCSKALGSASDYFRLAERYDSWFPVAKPVICALLGVFAFWVMGRDPDRKAYHVSAIAEARKVTWPTAEATQKMTWIVAVVVGVFSIILGAFDFVWSLVLRAIIS
ncbi:MAG: preprotein translocase subunit SecE [Oligoflexales bacterium]